MELDVRTILVMCSMLTLLFSGLLALAGFHAGGIRGVRQWAAANLCFGLGLGIVFFFKGNEQYVQWAVIFTSTCIALGVGLQFTGIQAFKGGQSNWRIVAMSVAIFFLLNVWFVVIVPDASARAISNALLAAIGYGACARALLIRIDPPMRSAYWFTGASFAILAVALLLRGLVIWNAPPGSFSLYNGTMLINPLSFFVSIMAQLSVTFGFILMLDYRLISNMQKLALSETQAKNEHRQFIAMLAHELRTPLAVIDGAVQSLEHLQQPQSDEVQLRHRRIRRSVGRISGLVKQFLDNDRLDDSRRLVVSPMPLDGVAVAHQALHSCPEGTADRVRLKAPASIPCRGDAALMELALTNLLDNALKYSPTDRPVEFQVETMERNGLPGVAWTVADQGMGIAPESREAVFGKYVRGPDHGSVAGTGLGLYFVRRIAEMHGGSVEILQRDGWGAVFCFWLPQEGEAACSA